VCCLLPNCGWIPDLLFIAQVIHHSNGLVCTAMQPQVVTITVILQIERITGCFKDNVFVLWHPYGGFHIIFCLIPSVSHIRTPSHATFWVNTANCTKFPEIVNVAETSLISTPTAPLNIRWEIKHIRQFISTSYISPAFKICRLRAVWISILVTQVSQVVVDIAKNSAAGNSWWIMYDDWPKNNMKPGRWGECVA